MTRVIVGIKGIGVILAPLVRKGLPGKTVPVLGSVPLDHKGPLELQVPRVRLAQLDHKVPPELRARKGLGVQLAPLARRAWRGFKVSKESKGFKVSLVKMLSPVSIIVESMIPR